MKYLGRVEYSKDATNKGYVDGGLASKVSTSDYSPVAKTSGMTQAVGKDANGQLWAESGVITVTVTGTTPSITAEANHRYVCGEVATLDFTPPASGICDVIFMSGSTAAVLALTGATMPEWFDATELEADKTYELNFMDGYGAVALW